MRFSQLLGRTLREAPADVSLEADRLAMRAGMLRRVAGKRSYLPLGARALKKIAAVAAESATALGGQEALLQEDEDSLAALDSDVRSHRDLPRYLFQADPRSRFLAASLHAGEAEFEAGFRAIYQSLLSVLVRCGLSVSAVEAGPDATEFVVPHPLGSDGLLVCGSRDCGYASLADLATFAAPEGVPGEARPLTKVQTPHCATIAALADFLKIETRQTIKAVMYTLDEADFVFAAIRGDLEVSEQKLLRLAGGAHLRPATEAEIRSAGAVPGYASPAGLRVAASPRERGTGRIIVVADPSIQKGANFATGANEAGYHFINANYPRDFQASTVADIALAGEAAPCLLCGNPLQREQAFLVGSCQRVGATRLQFLAASGRPELVWAGRYTLRVEAMLRCIIDRHRDDSGIVWPGVVAPFDIHLVRLGKAAETIAAADKLYDELRAAGRDVLYDDRDESPGVKFADADLIGIPLRLTVSERSLKAGGVEAKRRASAEKSLIAFADIARMIG